MLSALFAITVPFFNPALPNAGYVDVIAPTNPVNYAATLKGSALDSNDPVPRVEDMMFVQQLAFERQVVREKGCQLQPYLGGELYAEPMSGGTTYSPPSKSFMYNDATVFGGGDGYTPAASVFGMLFYAAFPDTSPWGGFVAVSGTVQHIERSVSSSPFDLPENYGMDAASYVLDGIIEDCSFSDDFLMSITNRSGGRIERSDLADACEIGDAMRCFAFITFSDPTNTVENDSGNMYWNHWTQGEGEGAGWQSTNETWNIYKTNSVGKLEYICESRKETTAYYHVDQSTGALDELVGDGHYKRFSESTEEPLDGALVFPLCADKVYYWDYQSLRTQSPVRVKSVTAFGIFYGEAWGLDVTSVHDYKDTTTYDEDGDCYMAVKLTESSSADVVQRMSVSDDVTNYWCEVYFHFNYPSIKSLAQTSSSYIGIDFPTESVPSYPDHPTWWPYFELSYPNALAERGSRIALVDLVCVMEFEFIATTRDQQSGQAEEQDNDNP